MSTIEPLRDHVLVRVADPDVVTPGGIHLPATGETRRREGTVVAVGPGELNADGILVTSGLKPGDAVLFEAYGAFEVTIDGVKHLILDGDEILAVRRS